VEIVYVVKAEAIYSYVIIVFILVLI